ncbi:hypothetical protein BDQ17DRAFT_1393921 [Cyathus striatus]|nr:hypothetical protein BDQ17DRAFT_1393921 [Cyathus striatus]
MASRTCCFAHIVNLVAKSFIAFFFWKPRKKVVEIAGDAVQPTIEEDDNTDLDNDKAISEEADASSDATLNDDGREMHDNAVIKTFEGKAILIMEQENIIIEESEHQIALGIFSRLTGNSNNNLSGFHLSEEQWKLAQQVEEVLLQDVPLVVDALPELEHLKTSLEWARNDTDAADVICVGAQAALLVLNKYSVFISYCEVYQVAMVMCPDRKLKWFKNNGRNSSAIKAIKAIVIKHWKETYLPNSNESNADSSEPKVSFNCSLFGFG